MALEYISGNTGQDKVKDSVRKTNEAIGNIIVSASTSGSTLTLTKFDGSLFTANTSVDLSGYLPLTGGSMSGLTQFGDFTVTGAYIGFNNTGIYHKEIDINPETEGLILYNDNGSGSVFTLKSGTILAKANSGITYLADYSANYTNRSLVDKEYVDSKKPYRVYTALLTQTGTSAPTAVVLENTLGETVVWNYDSTGNYYSDPIVGATDENCFVMIGGTQYGGNFIKAGMSTLHEVIIESRNELVDPSVFVDNALLKTAIEIRLYN